MTNKELLDAIRKEIKRRIEECDDHHYYLDSSEQSLGYSLALDDMLAFLDTLQEQPVAGLEEAPKEIYILQSKLAPNSLGACWHNHALPSNTCNNIKYIRADLDKQPVEGLEEEIERYCGPYNTRPVPDFIETVARHFAEWGAEHLKK